MYNTHEIDFKIIGEELQCVEIELDPQETVLAEAGAFMHMEDSIEMNTIFGDGSERDQGMLNKLFSAGKRILTGESLFITAFTNLGFGKRKVAFASPYPGKVIPLDLKEYQGKIICQKNSFLCAAKGVSIGIEFQRKIGVGLFGGEGFIMQKLEGDGFCFLHAGGMIVEKTLGPGELIRVDTGCLVAFTSQIDYQVEMVRGIRNAIFGGEGLFYASLRGPGKVWIQSMPFSRLADRVIAAAPKMGGDRRGEGSILGGLGSILGGDKRF